MSARRGLHIDVVALSLVAAIVLLGLIMVTSASISIASKESGNAFAYLERQLVLSVVGFVLAGIVFCVRTEFIEKMAWPLLIVAVALLFFVLVPGLGHVVNGSRRWIRLLGFNFQASELARVLVLVFVASYAVRRETELRTTAMGLIKPLGLLSFVALLLLQIQLLEAEHLPVDLNTELPSSAGSTGPSNVVRCGIEFDALGRRVAYHLYRSHPEDGRLAPMSAQGGLETVRVDAREVIHLYRVLRPGQIRGEPWLSRALVKLNELDQYDDAELVRKKTAAMFAGFVTRQSPEDNLMGEGGPDGDGIALAGLEPGTLQILEPGEDIKFSDPADVGGSYSEFLRTQFRAVAAALGITYEQLTGDLTGVNYSSIRAGLLEFRRRCEMVQHGVLVHQLCRPVWAEWMKQAVLAGALEAPGFARGGAARRRYLQAKWIPQGWQWVDPEKEFKAMLLAIRAGLMSRSEAISANGYDAEDVDREIAADNARADALGLVFDSDPRHVSKDGGPAGPSATAGGESVQ